MCAKGAKGREEKGKRRVKVIAFPCVLNCSFNFVHSILVCGWLQGKGGSTRAKKKGKDKGRGALSVKLFFQFRARFSCVCGCKAKSSSSRWGKEIRKKEQRANVRSRTNIDETLRECFSTGPPRERHWKFLLESRRKQ
eukprot:2354541-Amphidinium_carterae.1